MRKMKQLLKITLLFPLIIQAFNVHAVLKSEAAALIHRFNKGIIVRIGIKGFPDVVISINRNLRSFIFFFIGHLKLLIGLSILKFSIFLALVNPTPAQAAIEYPGSYEAMEMIYFCKRELILIKSAPFKGFYIRCEDTDRYGEYVRAGQLEKARALLQPGRWP